MRARTLILVLVGSGLAILTGLAREAAVAFVYGTGPAADAIVVASAVPLFLQVTLVSGVINANGVKMLVEARAEGGTRVVCVALGLAGAAVLVPMTLLAILVPGVLVRILAPTISGDAFSAAMELAPLMAIATMILYLGAIAGAVLNVRNHAPSVSAAQAIPGVTVAAALIATRSRRPTPYSAGFLLGAAGLLGVLSLRIRSGRASPVAQHDRFQWALVGRALMRLAPASGILFAGAILGQIAAIVERSVALHAGVGNLASIAYSTRLTNVPVSLSTSVIGGVLLVRLAHLRGDAGFEKLLSSARSMLGATLAAVAAFIYINAHLILQLLLTRGAFNVGSLARTEHFTQLFAIAIPAQVLAGLMAFAGYAAGRSVVFATAGVLTSVLNVLLLLAFAGSLGASAVPVAIQVTSMASFLLLSYLSGERVRRTRTGATAVSCIALCALSAWMFTGPLANAIGSGYLRLVVSAFVLVALAGITGVTSFRSLRGDLAVSRLGL